MVVLSFEELIDFAFSTKVHTFPIVQKVTSLWPLTPSLSCSIMTVPKFPVFSNSTFSGPSRPSAFVYVIEAEEVKSLVLIDILWHFIPPQSISYELNIIKLNSEGRGGDGRGKVVNRVRGGCGGGGG